MKSYLKVTRDKSRLRVAKVAQATNTSFDDVGQKPFSRIVNFVCILMEVKMLHRTESTIARVAWPWHAPSSSSKIVSSPPVVGVSVLMRRRTSICIVTWIITSSPRKENLLDLSSIFTSKLLIQSNYA